MERTMILFLLLLIPFLGIAQYPDINFTSLKIPNPPRLSVKSVYHDTDGYIWLGSWHSLGRFDGNKIRYYSTRELSNPQFKNNTAKLIFEDRKGNLWIATDNGCLMTYNKDLDKFIAVNDSTTSLKTQASSVVEDDLGNFWIGTLGAGLFYFNPQTKQQKHYLHVPGDPMSLPGDLVNEIAVDNTNQLWIATESGLSRYDQQLDKFISYSLQEIDSKQTKPESIQALYASPDGNLYMGGFAGFTVFDCKTFQYSNFSSNTANKQSISHNEISDILEDDNGKIWIATVGGGINVYDKRSKKFIRVVQDKTDPQSLPSNFISKLYFDKNKTLWVSTFENGIVLHNSTLDKIRYIKHNPNDPYSLPEGNVFSILSVNDSIVWIGLSRGGLNRLNIKTRKNQQFLYNPGFVEGQGNNTVEAIAADKSGNLWTGSFNGGLNMFDPIKNTFKRYVHHPARNSIGNNSVGTVFVDQSGNVWASHSTGVDMLDPKSGKFTNFRDDSLKRTHNLSLFGSFIFETNQGIWFTRPDQLVIFDKKEKQLVKLQIDTAVAYDFALILPIGQKIYAFTTDRQLTELILKSQDKIHVKEILKLNEDILAVCHDRNGLIWAMSSQNILRIDPKLLRYKKVHSLSPVLNEPIFPDIISDSQGRIFHSFIDEVCWFNTDDIEAQQPPLKIVLTDFKVFNNTIEISDNHEDPEELHLQKHISRLDVVELSYNHSFFSFEFSALEYFRPHNVQYAYKMEGFDKDWITIGNRKYASYTSLDPGNYTFKIKASWQEGAWSEQETSILVVVHPPFWKTWWFISLEILLISGLAYIFIRYKISHSVKMEILRNKIASDLHDEVGSSLTRITLYSDLLQNNLKETDKNSYLNSINNLSREIVNTLSDIVWSVDNTNDSLGELIIRMKDSASAMLRAKNIEVEFNIENINEKKVLEPLVKQNLYLIFKESINNVIKHANATHVRVRISNTHKGFVMSIQDNGKGIDLASNEKGNGLRNMDKRAFALKAQLTISNEFGTRVQISCKTI
jgi:ligand-binding sensor domain-containing protein/two-component sensor histidine kinase